MPDKNKIKRPTFGVAARLLGQYSGLNTMPISNYRPSVSHNQNAIYYTYPQLKQNVFENFQNKGRMPWDTPLDMSSFENLYKDINSRKDKNGNYSRTMSGAGLGGYTIGTGEDNGKKYISVYDVYNFGWLPFIKGTEIYDRIYQEDFDKYYPKQRKTLANVKGLSNNGN